jgi:hypothetical protein
MTKQNFAAALMVLASSYNRELPAPALEGYWLALLDLGEDALQMGLGRALREWRGKFMPTPPELRALCLGQGSPEQRQLNAAASWEVVHAAMNKYDYTSSVDFGPLTNAVVRNMGGWIWLCERSVNDLTFDRKKFEELHQAMSGTSITAERSTPLRGQFGGKPVLFQIPGEPERRLALPEHEGPGLSLVRDLADKKAAG